MKKKIERPKDLEPLGVKSTYKGDNSFNKVVEPILKKDE